MNKINKKAAANVPAFTTAKNESLGQDSSKLSDKIKFLYRYLVLNNSGKNYVHAAVDAAFQVQKFN